MGLEEQFLIVWKEIVQEGDVTLKIKLNSFGVFSPLSVEIHLTA